MKLILLLSLVVQITGCTSPAIRMDEQAAGLGYHRQVVKGEGYDHVVYIKPGRVIERSVLHVYLEGDGTPWVRKRLAAFDPTPRKPVMLALMALDALPSVYLGRPCYHGLSQAIGCTPDL